MLQEMLTKTAGKVNQVIYWGRPLDWRNQTLTPNPDTLYLMAFLNTKDMGPIVIDIPPAGADGSLNANIVNVWQVPLEDAGLLGVDKGKRVKLLMLPPGYSDNIPDGYVALQPGTFGSYALFRSNLASHSDPDVVKSLAYGKRVKIYPLSEASDPQPTVFTDVKDVVFDSTIRYDVPEGISGGSTFGLGDINYTGFLSPAKSGEITWGIGPSISFPSATDEKLGTEKWSAGPSAVALVTPGPWVVGALVRQLWSFAGDDDRRT
jgi:hypothetical protein